MRRARRRTSRWAIRSANGWPISMCFWKIAPARPAGGSPLRARPSSSSRNRANESVRAFGENVVHSLREWTGTRGASALHFVRLMGGCMSQINGTSAGPRILGIDPGLQVTGYAVLEARAGRPHICEAGIIKSAEGRSTTDLAPRLQSLYDGIVEIVKQFKP